MKKIMIGLIAVILLVSAAAGSMSEMNMAKDLEGIWQQTDTQDGIFMAFSFRDGIARTAYGNVFSESSSYLTLSYTVDGSKLVITANDGNAYEYQISLEGNKLTMAYNGQTNLYERVESTVDEELDGVWKLSGREGEAYDILSYMLTTKPQAEFRFYSGRGTMVFSEEDMSVGRQDLRYHTNGQSIFFSFGDGAGSEFEESGTYSIEGSTLTMKFDGATCVFEKEIR